MNELVWPTSTDALAMLGVLFPLRGFDSGEPQPRKSRWYLLACARQRWEQLPGVCRAVVSLAEQIYGTRTTNKTLLERVYPHAEALYHCCGVGGEMNELGQTLVQNGLAQPAEVQIEVDTDPNMLAGLAYLAYSPFSRTVPVFPQIPDEFHSADLVREIFGPRDCPRLEPEWLTDTVRQMAAAAENDLSLLPILADALQDTGCNRQDVLVHLRHPGPHLRWCWALHLVLGENEDTPRPARLSRSLPH
jgi:hypothetical protein